MAVDIYNSTTLSAAITATSDTFTVASTSNIEAGSILAIQGTGGLELVKVSSIPISGTVKVGARGVSGTVVRAHQSGARVFVQPNGTSGDGWVTIPESNDIGLIGNSGAFPHYAFPGAKARDGMGNEYIMVEMTATAYSGTTVTISVDGNFTAVQTAGGTHGTVGILVEPATSDQYAWAQIYGYNAYAQIDAVSAGTSAYLPVPATSVSTPSVGLAILAAATTSPAYIVHGMFLAGAVTSTVTSASSATGNAIPVFLNYPYVLARVESIDSSNS